MAGTGQGYVDEDETLITDINVTPLVDIVLVLLITFMITMPTIVTIDILNERQVKIALPQASEAKPLTWRPPQMVVNVEATGRYVVNEGPVSVTQLESLLKQAAAQSSKRVNVIIRADRKCAWQAVMNVMNLCNAAEITDYSVTALK